MADDNLKDFAVSWALFGLLFFCLMTFTITFMAHNNPTGLGNSQDIFENTSARMGSKLVQLPDDTDVILNVTAQTDPTTGYLGSRDSVSTTYGLMGTAKGFFDSTKIFIGWIFTGTSGQILLAVFGGLFSLLSVYFITKWVRNGI